MLRAYKNLPIIAVILSAIFWLADSAIDAYFFGEGTFMESLLSPEPVEFWMRFLVIMLLIGFSLYARHMLIKLNDINLRLESEVHARRKTEEELAIIATTDPLTQLSNRRKFNEILEAEISRELRYKAGLSIILCDIDRFKQINDRHGHKTGDTVLQEFSHHLKCSVRYSDLLARWGGEEFIILVLNSNLEVARSIAEKIRKHIEQIEFDKVGHITASFGVASFCEGENEEAFIHRADRALYKAKEKRNCVEINNACE